jgi:RHS repeat-associated protein
MNWIPNNGCPNGQCTFALNICWGHDNYVFRGLDGTQHSLAVASVYPDPNNSQQGYCPSAPGNQKSPGDRHGVVATLQDTSQNPPVQVIDQSGTAYNFLGIGGAEPAGSNYYAVMSGALASSITDRNGNQLTLNGNSYKDSTGRTAVSWSGIGTDGDTVTISGMGPVTLHWTTTPVSYPETGYNVGASSCSLNGGSVSSVSVVDEIDLPNQQKYQFDYDGTYGNISKVTFPDGGYVRYVWGLNHSAKLTHASWSVGTPAPTTFSCDFIFDIPAITDRYVSYDGTNEVLHQSFSYSTTWSGTSWTSKTTTVTSSDLLSGDETKTIYTYGPVVGDTSMYVTQAYYLNLIPVESNVVYQDGGGSTYKTEAKTWLTPQVMLGDQTILDNGQGTTTERCYDANEQVTNVYEYGFQSEGGYPGNPACYSATGLNTSAMGPLRRQTTTAYHPFWNGTTLTGTHIVNAPDSVTVAASGSSPTAQQTLYTYDDYSVRPSSAFNLSSPPGSFRGNATTIQKLISSTTYATTIYHYWDTGQLYTMTDACGGNPTCADMSGSTHTTTYDYHDNYASGTGTPPGQTFAYLWTVTDPLSHIDTFSWGFNDGLIRSHVDKNSLATSYAYSDPGNMARLTQIGYPDGGLTNVFYGDYVPGQTSYPSYVKTYGNHLNRTTQTLRDGLGHTTETQVTSDPQGTIYSDTTYDGFGRVWKQSNPYRNSDPTSSPGTTVYEYDALSRKISETYPDSSTLTTAYCGASTLVTDPTGHWRRSRTDGLGFLVEVDEPNAPGATVNVCPGTGEPTWVTTYGRDALGNLASVVQNGSRSRTFTYDALSRLLCSNNPENSNNTSPCPANGGTLPSSGAVLYTYDANSNVSTKTDARGSLYKTTYSYDVVNRLLSRAYSNGDPTVWITYDQTPCLGLSACQNIGYRTSMTDAAGSESWAYQVDKTNSRSVHAEKRTTNSITKSSTYYLDLAGNLTKVVYPTGRVVNYTYDAANRPATATDQSNGITYATGPTTPLSGCPSGEVCYTPQGSIYSISIGQTASFTGVNVQDTYSNRLQPNEIKASSSAGNALDLRYVFTDSNGHNAGHVYQITNVLNSSRTETFTYDQVNRIASAGTSATTGSYCWGYQYSYDAWGNLKSQAGWTPTYNACTEYTMGGVTPDNKNHITGLTYDAAGNTLSDGVNSYTWDGESEMKTAAGVTYTYDGDGRRVAKSNGKLYWYGSGGEILAETDNSGNMTAEYTYFAGQRVAMLPTGTNNAQYYVEDFLGSSRVVTTLTGTVCYDADFTPFGGERAYTSNCAAQNIYKFEGKERDAESGNDDFGARYYTWRMGRWLSSDWSSVPAPVPYANLTNPQTLSLYSMVADDPESFADLDGHAPGGTVEGYYSASDELDAGMAAYVAGLPQQTVADTKKDKEKAQQNNASDTGVTLPKGKDLTMVQTLMGEQTNEAMVGTNQYADDESGRKVGPPGGAVITDATLDKEANLMAGTMLNLGHIGNAKTYRGLPAGKHLTALAAKAKPGSGLAIQLQRDISAVKNATPSAYSEWRAVNQGFIRSRGDALRVAGTDFLP